MPPWFVTEDGKTVDYATYVVIESKPENTMTDNYLYVTGGYYGTTQDVNGDTVYLYKTIKDGAVVNLAKSWKTADYQRKKAVAMIMIHKILISEDGDAKIIWNV